MAASPAGSSAASCPDLARLRRDARDGLRLTYPLPVRDSQIFLPNDHWYFHHGSNLRPNTVSQPNLPSLPGVLKGAERAGLSERLALAFGCHGDLDANLLGLRSAEAPVSSARCSGEGGGQRGGAQDVLGVGQVGEGDEYGPHAAVS